LKGGLALRLLQQWVSGIVVRLGAGAKPARFREVIHILPKDAISAIDEPVFFGKQDGVLQMTESEQVIGVEINGDARAYPVQILSVHEIVNDVVGGIPIAVTWCPLSYSAVVYRRMVIDRALSFGVSGGILRNTLVMYDRQTGSLWNQLTGDAFSGALSGIQLQSEPAVLTTWGGWQGMYPASLALSKADSPYNFYEDDHMAEYYASEKTGIRPPARTDNRLPEKERILGIATESSSIVYPFSLLRQTRAIHDMIEGRQLVVFFDNETETARAYDADVAGTTLSFYESDGKYYDYQTNSLWSPLSGRSILGPLTDRRLRPLSGISAFWFAWADHYPETKVFELPVTN